MGCGSSKPPTPYAVTYKAYENQKPIDMEKLKQAVEASPGQINEVKEPFSFTPLSCVILNKNKEPEAVKLLVEKGADVFGGKNDFHDSPIGAALRYDCAAELEIMIVSLKEDGWKRLMTGIMKPPDITGGGVGVAAGVWVWVPSRQAKAKTKAEFHMIDTGKETTVVFGDGSQAKVKGSEIQPLPAVGAECKKVLFKMGQAAALPQETLDLISLLQEGHYGTMPRGWGTLTALATGGFALAGVEAFDFGGAAVAPVAAMGFMG